MANNKPPRIRHKSIILGLTGGIASGKSTVSSIFENDFHIPVIDADKISRDVVRPGSLGLFLIRVMFGRQVIMKSQPDSSGNTQDELDRVKLGLIVFSNPKARSKLNMITHPLIVSRMLWSLFWLKFVEKREIVVLDIPLLYDTSYKLWGRICTCIAVVYCSRDQQFERLLKRSQNPSETPLTQEQAWNRINAQLSIEEKARRADYILKNDRVDLDINHLKGEVQRLLKDINMKYGSDLTIANSSASTSR